MSFYWFYCFVESELRLHVSLNVVLERLTCAVFIGTKIDDQLPKSEIF